MSTTATEIGISLKNARVSLNYSIDDLAETCGLTADEISAVEDGTTNHPDHAGRIALALGLPWH